MQTYDFGYGGATVDPTVVPSRFGPQVQSFQQQVEEQFLPTYVKQRPVPWSAVNSLFTVFFGINDIIFAYKDGDADIWHRVVVAYEKHVTQVGGSLPIPHTPCD